MTEQFRLGDMIDNNRIKRADCSVTPLHDDAILSADENHNKQTIGGSGHTSSFSQRQYFVSVDPCSGCLKPKRYGGRVPARRYRVVPKYPKEARGCYGVAAPIIEGRRQGKFIKPFDYTLKKLVSYKVWKEAVAKEIKKRRNTKGKSSPWCKFKDTVNPYLARYGDGWEAKMEVEPGSELKPLRSCHQLMDHLILEGSKIWAGTIREYTWMIYHDHLKIFWEKETILYLKSLKCPIPGDNSTKDRNWFDRLIKIEGVNNHRVSNRYNHTLPGDSPELMPLDCHLFADLKEALARNIAFTFWMQKNDERKYKGGTPYHVYQSISRTIESNGVSEDRIIEDCTRIKKETLHRMLKSKGTYIEDSSSKTVRHGVRGQEHQDLQTMKVDPKVRDSFKEMIEDVLEAKQSCPIEFEPTSEDQPNDGVDLMGTSAAADDEGAAWSDSSSESEASAADADL
jgi:hypothetical protein